MNNVLLRQVAQAIEQFPRNFAMSEWYVEHRDGCDCDACEMSGETCETTACIAGWAVLLHYGEEFPQRKDECLDYHCEGKHLLELTEEQAAVLFVNYGSEWWRDAAVALGVESSLFDWGEANAVSTAAILRGLADGVLPAPFFDRG